MHGYMSTCMVICQPAWLNTVTPDDNVEFNFTGLDVPCRSVGPTTITRGAKQGGGGFGGLQPPPPPEFWMGGLNTCQLP